MCIRDRKYSAYLGGLQVANIFYSTGLENDKWEIKTTITASGLVDVFVSFTFSAKSSGKYINDRLITDAYNFSYEIKNKNKSRFAEILYKDGIPISVTANPKYKGEDIPTPDFLKKYGEKSSDPNSAFVVSNKLANPCLENSRSFDLGIEKSFSDLNLDIEATYFDIKYDDVLEGWKTGNSSGLNYTTQNMPGTVKSKGLELTSKFKLNDHLNFGFNYTYTSTYDGAEQDDPDKNSSYYNAQMVRVPRNLINLSTNFKLPGYENLNISLNEELNNFVIP